VASIQNKVGAFLADPILNRILTTSKSDIHVRKIMDEGKILLVNLAKGRLGEDSSSLLGGLLVLQHTVALTLQKTSAKAFLRTWMSFRALRQWPSPTCSQNCASTASRSRSPTNICINSIPISATQYWETPETIISFRVGAEDAPYLAREFVGQFDDTDLVQLPNYRIYLKLMIDGSPSRPFSGVTLMPDSDPTSHV
jgi:hypothetical protein